MEIPERKIIPSQAGRQCNPFFPRTIPFPANTLYVCERGGEGCNALIAANDRGEGKGGGGERRRGRRVGERVEVRLEGEREEKEEGNHP